MTKRFSTAVKILAISHLFPHLKEKRYGIFAARQLSEIHRLGAEITVIVPRVWCPRFLQRFERWKDYDHNCPLCQFEGLNTISAPYIRPPGNWYNRWSGFVVFNVIRKKVLRLHKEKRFDIIYATDLFPDGDAAVRLSKYLRTPATCLCIGVDVNITAHTSNRMYRHFVKTAKALDGVLTCGQSVADGVKAVTGKNPLCVYGVLDLEEFSPASDKTSLRKELGLPSDKTIALYAGYLMKRKGIYELVEAFYRARQKYPHTLLVMCGGGPEKAGLENLARERNIEHSVLLVGEVEPEQMSKWMKASNLFVLASHTEGMPNVMMEAMACGLPVIATTVGGLPEAIGDCEGAILVPPKNIEALEEAMVKVIADHQLQARMQIASRTRAEERFSVKRNARRILDYLQEIVEKNRAK